MHTLNKCILIFIPIILFGIPIVGVMFQHTSQLLIAAPIQTKKLAAEKPTVPEIKEAKFVTAPKPVEPKKTEPVETKQPKPVVTKKAKPSKTQRLVKGAEVVVNRIDYGTNPIKTIRWFVRHGAHVVHSKNNVIKSVYNFQRSKWESISENFNLDNKVRRNITVESAAFTYKKPVHLVIDARLWSRLLAGYADQRSSTALKIEVKGQKLIVTDAVSNKTWAVSRG